MSTLLSANIVFGGEITDNEAQSYSSLGHYVLDKLKSFGERTLLINAATDEKYSAKFLHDSVVRLARALKKLGIESGDVIGLSSANCIEFAITLFAAFAVNATVSPLNVTYTEREVEHAINLSKPKILFCAPQTVKIIARVAKRFAFVKQVVAFGDSSSDPDIPTLEQLMRHSNLSSDGTFVVASANKWKDVCLIMCSSGTTGLPKGVQLTHKNLLASFDSQIKSIIPVEGLTMLSVIPWFHVFGCVSLIISLTKRGVTVFLPKFDEHHFLSAIEKYRVAWAFMVPPLMVFLSKSPLVAKYDLSSLETLLCGAAPLSKETEDLIKQRIGVPTIRQGYGLSETTLGIIIQTETHCKPGSVGMVQQGIYAKVIDPETGKVLGPNERGELCFKGDSIMKGYIGDVSATHAIIRNGWLHTGDIGYYDNDLEFFIVDRIKELIKYKGYQVPPAEIEALLLTNAKIKDAAVIGKPDEEAGELPLAFVVKQANVQLSEDEVKQFVANSASPAKRLRGGVIFVNEIPKNPSGKILRRVLRELLKKQQLKPKL